MKRFLRGLLYWLAMLSGIIGLVAGGKSLGKYALARLNDPYFDSFSYNDLVFSGGVIFLLSLILMILANIGHALTSESNAAKPEKSDSAAKPSGDLIKTTGSAGPAGQITEPENPADRESADEKLARLLKQNKE